MAPASLRISSISRTGGMSSSSIRFFMNLLVSASMPGRPPSIVGIGIDGLPTVGVCRWSSRFSVMMSSPQKVKNRLASMPLMRAPLARIRPG